MIRLILILVAIAVVSLGIDWVANEPGHVSIDWAYYHIETSLLFLLSLIAFASLFCVLFYLSGYMLVRGPIEWKRARLAKRQMLGLESITQTFTAIATQDLKLARKKLAQAKKHLPHQPLTLMLSAQIARLEGDESNARLYIEKMLGHEATELMALRSLIETARNANNDPQAINYAEKALATKPSDNWVISTLAELYAKNGRGQDAEALLENSRKKRFISRQDFKRESAYLLYENAKTFIKQKRYESAIHALEESLSRMPGFIPSTCLLSDIYARNNKVKKALKLIHKAWKVTPHKDLHDALLKALQNPENKRKFLSLALKIAKTHPENEQSRLLMKEIDTWDLA